MNIKLVVAAFLVSSLAGAQQVRYNYDRSADFSNYKTYNWANLRNTGVTDPLLDRDIKSAIESELSKKGMLKVDSGASVMIAYQASVGHERQLQAWGSRPRWGGMGQARQETISTGNLVLDFYTPRNRELVWRGVVSKTLNVGSDPNKNYKHLQKAIAKLLAKYPPKPGK